MTHLDQHPLHGPEWFQKMTNDPDVQRIMRFAATLWDLQYSSVPIIGLNQKISYVKRKVEYEETKVKVIKKQDGHRAYMVLDEEDETCPASMNSQTSSSEMIHASSSLSSTQQLDVVKEGDDLTEGVKDELYIVDKPSKEDLKEYVKNFKSMEQQQSEKLQQQHQRYSIISPSLVESSRGISSPSKEHAGSYRKIKESNPSYSVTSSSSSSGDDNAEGMNTRWLSSLINEEGGSYHKRSAFGYVQKRPGRDFTTSAAKRVLEKDRKIIMKLSKNGRRPFEVIVHPEEENMDMSRYVDAWYDFNEKLLQSRVVYFENEKLGIKRRSR
ncbi:MAG: hypothetical protein EXX96DRAFT_590821 [Benjaminiella poitrasii]|nr:MAG: hypothetical protein EXX96DRAFT_590821 [Benjaminiella poitrasii]